MSGLRSGTDGDLSWPLDRALRLHAEHPAAIYGDRSVTYAELGRRVGGLGAGLAEQGVQPGGRVGVLAENSLAHLEAWLGVPAAGLVLCSLNIRLAEDELAFIIDDAEIEVLLVDDDRQELGRSLRARCSSLRVVVHVGAAPCPGDFVPYDDLVEMPPLVRRALGEHDLAAISFTGGTTGSPKGVMLSHGNLLANARHNLIATGHVADDRWLHVCPMFHVAGTANVFAATWVGATQVILPRFDAAAVLQAISEERISHVLFVPTMLSMLVSHPDVADADISSLRQVQYAASPIAPDLQRRVLEWLTCDVSQFYGMTEAAPSVTVCGPEIHRRGHAGEEPASTQLASVGVPIPGVQVDVRGSDGATLPPGEIGELCVRGPNIMLGYWKRPDETSAALVDGWYRSGDAACTDADGYLYIVDRIKDMIISGGENVYSVEVEAVLVEHQDVIEAAVFGIPDERWGEAVHAVVAVPPGAEVSEDDLVAHCRERIAGFKVPRSFDLWDRPLPKSGAGKMLKHQLREPYWAGRERNVS